MKNYCKCGCGGLVNNLYMHGHNRKNKEVSIETRDKLKIVNNGKSNPRYGVEVSKETSKKMSISQSGRKHSEETLIKMRNYIPWNKDKVGVFSKEALRKIGEASKGRKYSKEVCKKISVAKLGDKNPQWQGGISFASYGRDFNEVLKESIRKRDKYCCRLCNVFESNRKHQVHHIDYNKKNNGPNNLITLCVCCHARTNSNRKYWENILASKVAA